LKRGEKTSRDRYPAENKGKPRSRLRSKSGFSLLEVLIGATVLAVGLLGLASMFPVAYVNVDSGGKLTEATALAQSFLEQLRTMGTNNFGDIGGDFPPNGLNGLDTANCQGEASCLAWQGQVDLANGGQLPQGRVRVALRCFDALGILTPTDPVLGCGPSQTGEITVTVNWTDLRRNQSVILATRLMVP